MRTHTRTCIHRHTQTRRHAHTHACTYAHTHVCMHAHMHTCAHAHMHTCTCTHPDQAGLHLWPCRGTTRTGSAWRCIPTTSSSPRPTPLGRKSRNGHGHGANYSHGHGPLTPPSPRATRKRTGRPDGLQEPSQRRHASRAAAPHTPVRMWPTCGAQAQRRRPLLAQP